jgi:phosphatidylethanolamine/phosphatidyl-N-methylethanolamine N-methyltransferase
VTSDPTFSEPPSAAGLFFRRWLADPLGMGSIIPSSSALRRAIARNVRRSDDQIVVEFGGGTGAVTKGLLANGVPGDRIWSIEIDGELARFLSRQYPAVNVVEGDAREADRLIPAQHVGNVGTVIVGIPMVMLPRPLQTEIIDAIFRIMPPGSRFLLYTYCITSPLPLAALGLKGERLAWTPANFPPASVWGYWRA